MNIDGTKNDDEFTAAFADFSSPTGGLSDDPPAADPPAADPPAADPPAADPPAADPPVADPPVADPPAADPSAADPPAADLPAQSADDILSNLADLMAKRKPVDAPVAATATADAPAEQPVFSTDEQEFLVEYEKDWEQVSKGEGLKRRHEYQQLLGFIFKQVADYVKPIRDTTEVLAERTHVSDVRGAVPDYSDNLRDEVEAWAKLQPAYLQSAYNQVITTGTVDEVKDLVARYRAETGKATVVATTPKPKGNELSGEAKKAVEALAPVESKRSGVQQPDDPSNFDDAWRQAAIDLV